MRPWREMEGFVTHLNRLILRDVGEKALNIQGDKKCAFGKCVVK